eukprot:scaffold269238_cov19-Tisochrysis_lutea.AAC.1
MLIDSLLLLLHVIAQFRHAFKKFSVRVSEEQAHAMFIKYGHDSQELLSVVFPGHSSLALHEYLLAFLLFWAPMNTWRVMGLPVYTLV